eukprot:TRINITY_DN25827_c0_g1_i1.p1 TRINITY_DN25827_c0_g1~~TRINITY_DN25827_c0_g1_i1.p1  ORF type:complete len:192 (-),score=44.18 TRINITY_DN25827_c0_g1_i1:25-561(-)
MTEDYKEMGDDLLSPETREVIQNILEAVRKKKKRDDDGKEEFSQEQEYKARIELICRYFKANSSPSSIPNLGKVVSSDVEAVYPSGTFRGRQVYLEHCTKTLANSASIFSLHRVSLRADEFTLDLGADRAFARWNFEYKVKGCGCFCSRPSVKYGFNVFEFVKEEGELKISYVRTVIL